MIYSSPIGSLHIQATPTHILSLQFTTLPPTPPTTPLLHTLHAQLSSYFSQNLTTFSLPLHPQGTPFQHTVWNALLQIPYGKTLSYQQLAQLIHHPKATRAVAQALHHNPLPILIPCHRVIHKDGTLGGFAPGPDKKQWLLNLELVP